MILLLKSFLLSFLIGQTWRLHEVTEKERAAVEDAIKKVDGVSNVIVDVHSKTLNVTPRPQAVIDAKQIEPALKLVPKVKLGPKLSDAPAPTSESSDRKLDFPPDKITHP